MALVTANNKRIAKNTLFLYIRMLLTMAITLYTSRIVLTALGVEDFGIYNVVGGVVSMFSFLNGTMAASTQRFLSYELGKNDIDKFQKVFNQSIIIHCGIALAIIVLSESVGYWFILQKLNIPTHRVASTLWVFHFAILSLAATIVQVPFNAMIIAQERMSMYAFLSIIEVGLKLLVALSLGWFMVDKLKLYGCLIFVSTSLTSCLYVAYCRYKFKHPFKWALDSKLGRSLFSFAGWNLSAHVALLGRTQGLNILLNLFFGPTVNAARGIAVQVHSATTAFVSNFKLAANPQIVKLYAQKDYGELKSLIIDTSRYSCLLLAFILIPLYVEMEQVLHLWLNIVPEHTAIFAKLTLLSLLADTFSGNLGQGALATGKIKKYQLTLSILFLMIPLFSYILLKRGFPAETVFIIDIVANIIALSCRLFFLHRMIKLPVFPYLKQTVLLCVFIMLLSSLAPVLITHYFSESFMRLVGVTLASSFSMIITSYFFGLNAKERNIVKAYLLKYRKYE